MKKRLLRIWSAVRNSFKRLRVRIGNFVKRHPFWTFLVILGLVLVLIAASNAIGNRVPPEKEHEKVVKQIETYQVGSVPEISVQAHVEKSGVITISALSGGVVKTLNKEPGDTFKRGEVLVSMASNYQGGNLFSLQRQLAQTQYNNVVATFDTQKNTISKQREVAEKTDANADEIRNITDKSRSETQDLINLNETILRSIDDNLTELESTNVNGANDALILTTQQMKSQFLAATNGAKQALRSSEFQASGDKIPAALSNLQKDIALQQLDIQEKMLEMNREVSRIQLNIARVNEGLMFPTAPFSGTVQRVFVKAGQSVSPGTPLMIVAQNIEDDPIVAVALVSSDIAKRISELEAATVHVDADTTYETFPSYVSQEAVNGTLHAVFFPIPDEYNGRVTENGFIQIDIPVGYADTSSSAPFVPIDAIYQSRNQDYLFVIEDGKAVSRTITLGQIYGDYIEVTSGLEKSDQVVLDRTVVAGDLVTAISN